MKSECWDEETQRELDEEEQASEDCGCLEMDSLRAELERVKGKLEMSHNAIRELQSVMGENRAIDLAAQLDTATQLAADLLEEITSLKGMAVELEKVIRDADEWVSDSKWIKGECAWCGNFKDKGHAPDCARQAILGKG